MASALLIGLLAGCIERRMVILTDPPNVRVYLDGHDIGLSEPVTRAELAERFGFALRAPGETMPFGRPVIDGDGPPLGVIEVPFVHYAAYEVVLTSPAGYATQRHIVRPEIPFYEWFPLDFIFDVLLPLTFTNQFVYRFTMEKAAPPDYDTVYEEAVRLRNEVSESTRADADTETETDADDDTSAPE